MTGGAFTDPQLAIAGYGSSPTDYPLTAGGRVRVARNNPGRVALGFFCQTVATKVFIAPWFDASSFPSLVLQDNQNGFITLTDVSILVCQEWYAFSQDVGFLRVVEIIQTGGGFSRVSPGYSDWPATDGQGRVAGAGGRGDGYRPEPERDPLTGGVLIDAGQYDINASSNNDRQRGRRRSAYRRCHLKSKSEPSDEG